MRHAVALLALSGCAFLFQEHVQSPHAGSSEPRCTTSPGWYLWDGLIAVGDGGLLLLNDRQGNPLINGPTAAAVIVSGIVHFGSMIRGYEWAAECEQARADYDRQRTAAPVALPIVTEGQSRWCFRASHDALCFRSPAACTKMRRQTKSARGECEHRGSATEPDPEPVTDQSRGFVCTSSPSVVAASLCTRGEVACSALRGSAVAAVPDLGECVTTDVVWCFDPQLGSDAPARCAASSTACNAQRDAALAGASDGMAVGACVDVR